MNLSQKTRIFFPNFYYFSKKTYLHSFSSLEFQFFSPKFFKNLPKSHFFDPKKNLPYPASCRKKNENITPCVQYKKYEITKKQGHFNCFKYFFIFFYKTTTAVEMDLSLTSAKVICKWECLNFRSI